MTIETENERAFLCGNNGWNRFFRTNKSKFVTRTHIHSFSIWPQYFLTGTFYLDITFSSDWRSEGKGFRCSVRCSKAPQRPERPQNPALEKPWAGCRCGNPNRFALNIFFDFYDQSIFYLLSRITKIVGGVETLQHEFPWMVSVTKVS